MPHPEWRYAVPFPISALRFGVLRCIFEISWSAQCTEREIGGPPAILYCGYLYEHCMFCEWESYKTSHDVEALTLLPVALVFLLPFQDSF